MCKVHVHSKLPDRDMDSMLCTNPLCCPSTPFHPLPCLPISSGDVRHQAGKLLCLKAERLLLQKWNQGDPIVAIPLVVVVFVFFLSSLILWTILLCLTANKAEHTMLQYRTIHLMGNAQHGGNPDPTVTMEQMILVAIGLDTCNFSGRRN